jgi:ATP-dependent Clp protease ATP-binding subunit ClpC
MTSNVGAKKVSEFGGGLGFVTSSSESQKEQIKKSIVEKSLKQQFNPEFLNRIDDIVLFNTLNKEDIKKIIEIELKKLENRLSVKNYKISFDESVLNEIEKLNTMEEYGARPVKRIIQNLCEDFLSDEILKGNIKENQVINLKFEDEHMKIF